MPRSDIEAVLVAALIPVLGVPVATERPEVLPDLSVLVRATGGPDIADHVLDRATVAWEVTGHDKESTADLALALPDALHGLVGSRHAGAFVADVSCTRPQWFPNEDRLPRYSGSAELLIHHN